MTQEKLSAPAQHRTQCGASVRKIREILRLKHEVGLSNRAIARACSISNSTVGDYVVRAKRAGLGWPLPDELREEDLYRKLFPEVEKPRMEERPLPDGETVHRDLARKGVTLKLLWQEYREKYPDGYGYTQFREHYQRWNQSNTTSRDCHTKAEKCWKWTMPG